jgi:hypothetical protein
MRSCSGMTSYDLLRQARQAQVAAAQQARALRQQAEAAENEQMMQAAASSAAEGDLALTELHYRQAAELFKEAADLVPAGIGHESQRIGYLRRALKAKSETARIAAIRELLDRGYGRPRQAMEVSAPAGDPLQLLLDEIDARIRIDCQNAPNHIQLPSAGNGVG